MASERIVRPTRILKAELAVSGDLGQEVLDTEIGCIALPICMDIQFVETARLADLNGADVICHVSNWLAEHTLASS